MAYDIVNGGISAALKIEGKSADWSETAGYTAAGSDYFGEEV